MSRELPKIYEPQQVEDRIYKMWEEGGFFKPQGKADAKPFTIVMPPPNVTGQLHMGHAMDATLQDTLIRFKRMQGYDALWVPGVDHAGIATQIKVEEELRTKEGLSRYDLGREKFLERVWDWKHRYGNRIVEQQKKLGASCDWDRARFTMDEGCSKAVREVFVSLYEKGRGMLLTTEAGEPPISIAGAYTAMGLMEEPTGIFMSVARLRVFFAVGSFREPIMALISPVR